MTVEARLSFFTSIDQIHYSFVLLFHYFRDDNAGYMFVVISYDHKST